MEQLVAENARQIGVLLQEMKRVHEDVDAQGKMFDEIRGEYMGALVSITSEEVIYTFQSFCRLARFARTSFARNV